MQRDYWFSVAQFGKDPPEQVGRVAAERTIRRLGRARQRLRKSGIFIPWSQPRSLNTF
jgi:hypothetical protein